MSKLPSEPRYAIYYAPESGSALAQFGAAWLGRDAETNVRTTPMSVPGIDAARLGAVTAEPRRYGFHGTLKAPIRLRPGIEVTELEASLAGFAARRSGFTMPPLFVTALGSFLALVPSSTCTKLNDLAAECVKQFDAFRAAPSAAELEKRRSVGLTDRQSDYLLRWGYPHVLEEFRFHLTLTGRIRDADERQRTSDILSRLTAPLCEQAITVESICLFEQSAETEPFIIRARYKFG